MAIKNAERKITYHILKFVKKKNDTVIYNLFDFNDFATWFNTIDDKNRLYGISATKFTSLDFLETVPKRFYEGYANVVFGMMSTGNHGSRRNLKDSQNNTKRENPKKLEEGEEQENYFLLAFKTAGDIEVVFQNSAHSIKHHQFKDYLEKFIIKYISFKGTTKDFDIIEGSVIEDENTMIDKLDRVTKTKLYIEKSILDNELGLSNKTLQVKEDLILEVSAMRDQSLKELLKDMRQNLLYKNKVDKLWIEGKDSKGNRSSFFIHNIEKRSFVGIEINPSTAELVKDDVRKKLLTLI